MGQLVGEDCLGVGESHVEDTVAGSYASYVPFESLGELYGGHSLMLDEIDNEDDVGGISQSPNVVIFPLLIDGEEGGGEGFDSCLMTIGALDCTVNIDILPDVGAVRHIRHVPDILVVIYDVLLPVVGHLLRVEEVDLGADEWRGLIEVYSGFVLLVHPVAGEVVMDHRFLH